MNVPSALLPPVVGLLGHEEPVCFAFEGPAVLGARIEAAAAEDDGTSEGG